MKFNNRHNKPIIDNGKMIWISRSVAVVSLVLARIKDIDYILMVQRHAKATSPNLWCMPCGFLDWDETAGEAAIRETWEESGLDLKKLRLNSNSLRGSFTIFDNEPWSISTTPNVENQNVVLYFSSGFEVCSLPMLSTDNSEPDEIQNVKWVALDGIDRLDIAFNHDKRIKLFLTNNM